ncbi:UNVERIFIED_CONTAM: hypothetical protein K2H54_010773 [Gekko kuhli]
MGSTFHGACSQAATESLGSLYRNEMPLIKNGCRAWPCSRSQTHAVCCQALHPPGQSYELGLEEKRHKIAQQVVA